MSTAKSPTYLIIIFFVSIFISLPAFAKSRCKIETLRNVCQICEERALSKLDTDSVCPEVKCPEVSKNCTEVNSFDPYLRSSYVLTGKIREDQAEEVFKLNISKNQGYPGLFFYDVFYKNLETALKDSVGFLLYDIISFNLPVKVEENVISYNCLGVIDDYSFLNGICSTIAPNELGESKSYSWSFTGIPSSVH